MVAIRAEDLLTTCFAKASAKSFAERLTCLKSHLRKRRRKKNLVEEEMKFSRYL